MIKENYKLILRRIGRNKEYFLINTGGLVLATTCVISIFIWVKYELSYDKYHRDIDQIHHAYLMGSYENNESLQMTVSPFVAKALKDNIPEVLNTARCKPIGRRIFTRKELNIFEEDGIAVEESVFDILTIDFIYGDKTSVLKHNYNIVLTESLAKKYFGGENPVGKKIEMDNEHPLTVSGVVKDVPSNSSRKFDYLVPYSFLQNLGDQTESNEPFYPCHFITFVKLQKGASLENINNKFKDLYSFQGEDVKFTYNLIPLKEIHNRESNSKQRVLIFSLVGFFILCLACINYINLSIAMSFKRAKEISIRKLNGAFRITIIKQFLTENFLLVIISILIALSLSGLLIKYYNSISGSQIKIEILNSGVLLLVFGILLFTGLITGLYPAFRQSSFKVIGIHKDSGNVNSVKGGFKKSLLIFQFVVAIIFIVGSIGIGKQVRLFSSFDPGFDKNNMLYISLEGELRNNYEIIKSELLSYPEIENVTTASNFPNRIYGGNYYNWGKNDNVDRRVSETYVGYDYLKTFSLEIAEGRFFSKAYSSDLQNSVVVNEYAIKEVDLKDPIGKPFYFNGRYLNLIGIVKDFHHKSPVHNAHEPVIFFLRPENNAFMFVKLNEELASKITVDKITSLCNNYTGNYPLLHGFVDENQIGIEQNMQVSNKLIIGASILAIFISFLGLYGLVSLTIVQKIKEIGIRKVNGARVRRILAMLNIDFLKWVSISFIIACPIAWYAMQALLDNFAIKTKLNWWIFALAGIIVSLVAAITVSWRSWSAARRNPVESLRYE